MKIINGLTNAFPLWALLASILALYNPAIFTWFSGIYITLGLGVIMLGMGLTLQVEDFRKVMLYPSWLALGVFLQFLIMPLLGWGLAFLFGLPSFFAAGLILVASCPGGTASNVISFLAKVDVALSVSMTTVSTMIAVVLTPFMTSYLVGSRVEMDSLLLLYKMFQVIVVPITLGILLRRYFKKLSSKLLPFSPLVAVFMIVLIVASIIGKNNQAILEYGLSLAGAVVSLHVLGFFIGYVVSRLVFKNKKTARTISIEVGMQNSGLGVVLASQIPNSINPNPLIAVPSAISSLVHSLLGSLLAAIWRRDFDKEI